MRILLVHNEYQIVGGEERVVRELESSLASRGHQVWVHRRRSGDWDKLGFSAKLKMALQVPFSFEVFTEISDLISRYSPDVIHAHNIFPFMTPSVYFAANKRGVPVVQSFHNFRFMCMNGLLLRDFKPCELCVGGNVLNGVIHRCYQGSRARSMMMAFTIAVHRFLGTWGRRIDRIIASSEFSRRMFSRGGLPDDKISVIPNGIDIPVEKPGNSAARDVSLIYVGRLSPEKGIKTMLEGYALFAKMFPLVPLDVLGDGPLMPFVRSFQEKNPALKLRVHGFVDAAKRDELLGKASHLLFPSECYENCPYAVLESMALGIPVIASNHGGIPELVVPGESGWLFKPGSPQDLADCLASAVRGHDQWCELSRATRLHAGKYGMEKWLDQIEACYRSVINANAPELQAVPS